MNNPQPGEWVKAANGATGRLLEVVRLRRSKGALVAVIRFGSYDSCYSLAALEFRPVLMRCAAPSGAVGSTVVPWRISALGRRLQGVRWVAFAGRQGGTKSAAQPAAPRGSRMETGNLWETN